uniref:Glutamate receptor 2.8 n=1 Tax=Cajanus cajan TaxID=3821 RepID=A0A151QYP7_CAJCA|nr:Glutamate receptor 2.8 [Cajanus cajan]
MKQYFDAVIDVTIISYRYQFAEFTQPYTDPRVVMVVPLKSNVAHRTWLFLFMKPFTNTAKYCIEFIQAGPLYKIGEYGSLYGPLLNFFVQPCVRHFQGSMLIIQQCGHAKRRMSRKVSDVVQSNATSPTRYASSSLNMLHVNSMGWHTNQLLCTTWIDIIRACLLYHLQNS